MIANLVQCWTALGSRPLAITTNVTSFHQYLPHVIRHAHAAAQVNTIITDMLLSKILIASYTRSYMFPDVQFILLAL